MQNHFRSIDSVLQSGLAATALGWQRKEAGTDRIIKSKRLDDQIYADLRAGDTQMDGLTASTT